MYRPNRIFYSFYSEDFDFIKIVQLEFMTGNFHHAFLANIFHNDITKTNPYIVNHFAVKRFMK